MKFDNAHEMIEYVRDELIKQGYASIHRKSCGWNADNEEEFSTYCAYRGDRGFKCAVGMLIEDDEYTEFMEEQGAETIIMKYDQLDHLKPYMSLLEEMQTIHDSGEDASSDEFKEMIMRRYTDLLSDFDERGQRVYDR